MRITWLSWLVYFFMTACGLAATPLECTTQPEIEKNYVLNQNGARQDAGYGLLIAPMMGSQNRHLRYNPSLLTIAASIESRNYDRGDRGRWEEVALPWPDTTASYYTRPPTIHASWAAPRQKRVFLLLGASYSTWQHGTWTNKTVALLNESFDRPHLVAMAGFLSPEFLRADPRRPAMTVQEPAHDLYQRLRAALVDWKQSGRIPKDSQVGLVGFSGGASLAVALLAEDQRECDRHSPHGKLLFNQGAVALSPVVDMHTSFQVLDRANAILDARGFPPNRALTKPIFPDFLLAAFHGYTSSNPAPFLRLSRQGSGSVTPRLIETIGRFYREFISVDLTAVSLADYPEAATVGIRASQARRAGAFNYERYFAMTTENGLPSSDSSLATAIGRIRKAPIYIVFAQDDPVLSRIDPELEPDGGAAMPPRVAAVVRRARLQRNVRVFTPRRGAHLGYFLDTQFLRAVFTSFFGQVDKSRASQTIDGATPENSEATARQPLSPARNEKPPLRPPTRRAVCGICNP